MGWFKRLSDKYKHSDRSGLYSLSQPLERRASIPHHKVEDRSAPYVPFYKAQDRGSCLHLLCCKVYKELERRLKLSHINMSVDKVLAMAQTVTTIEIKLPLNKQVIRKTMIMERHKRIAPLFGENFWGTQ